MSAAVALVLVAVCVMAAGCVDHATTGKSPAMEQTLPVSQNPTVTIVPVTTIPTVCPAPDSGSYWIIISPVSNATVGDRVFISGSTTVPPGRTLDIWISHPSRTKSPVPDIRGTVNVEEDGDCTSTFRFIFDTTGLNAGLNGTRMAVDVYSSDRNLYGDNYPANRSEFFLSAARR